MDKIKIINLLTNSGLNVVGADSDFIYFQDPSCILSAFDKIFYYAWIAILVFIAIMLFGWGLLYIKNGFKTETFFNNVKNLILFLAVFAVIKPAVNVIYGDDLFGRQCDIKQVEMKKAKELLDMREEKFSNYDQYMLSESFEVIDSGIYWDADYSDQVITQYNEPNIEPQVVQTIVSESTTVTTNQSNFARVEYGKGYTIYVSKTGERIKRSGGSLAWRNNNPGNIRKSKNSAWLGAIGETDAWAVFADEESGLRAITKLLRGKNYINLSIKDAIYRWAPSSDGNDPEKYYKTVSQRTGIDANTKVGSLSDKEIMSVAREIQRVEGWIIGKEERI